MGGTKASPWKRTVKKAEPASPIAQTIQVIMDKAVNAGASDVHFEPRTGYGVVRQRIDGILQVTAKLPGASYGAVVAHLKRLAGLDEGQRLMPQAGRYHVTVGRRSYEIHLATLPVLDGERITLHISDIALAPATLAELGFWGEALGYINQALLQPRGLVVVSSSDQTSILVTLGSMLRTLSSPHLNLATVEQKMLYQLPNVDQTEVKREIGMTFGRRLRQILGHQPDVVMVSDVLDQDTAKTIVSAAAHKQLVLAGVHAPNAVGALSGLLQLADEPTLVSACFQVATATKLVPQLCPHCREAYVPDAELIRKLNKIFGIDNEVRMRKLFKLELEALGENVGVGSDPDTRRPSTTVRRIVRLWHPHAGGCKACNHTGYAGRTMIHEIIPTSTALQAALHTATVAEIRKAARTHGMIPLVQDALVKALRGVVPIETVLVNTSNR